MEVWRGIKVAFGRSEIKSAAIGLDPVTASFLGYGLGNAQSPAGALELWKKSTIVQVPVNWIAGAFSSINPVLKNLRTEAYRYNDPVLDLLRAPSPFYTAKLFKEHLAVNTLVTGESGIMASGPFDDPPVELSPVSPKHYEPRTGRGGTVDRYTIHAGAFRGEYLQQALPGNRVRWVSDGQLGFAEFRQIRNFSPDEDGLLRGLSPLVAASNEVRQHVEGGIHNVQIIERGGRLSLRFHYKQDIPKGPKWTDLVHRIRSQYGGIDGSQNNGIIVTSGEALEVSEMGQTPKDMDFPNLAELARMALCNTYKFPLALVFLDAATLDNLRASKVSLWYDAALPLADLIFDPMSDFLLPRYDIDPAEWRITYDTRQIPALRSVTLDQLAKEKEIGIKTLGEMRKVQGLPKYNPKLDPDDEKASPEDFIWASTTLQPLGTSAPAGLGMPSELDDPFPLGGPDPDDDEDADIPPAVDPPPKPEPDDEEPEPDE